MINTWKREETANNKGEGGIIFSRNWFQNGIAVIAVRKGLDRNFKSRNKIV